MTTPLHDAHPNGSVYDPRPELPPGVRYAEPFDPRPELPPGVVYAEPFDPSKSQFDAVFVGEFEGDFDDEPEFDPRQQYGSDPAVPLLRGADPAAGVQATVPYAIGNLVGTSIGNWHIAVPVFVLIFWGFLPALVLAVLCFAGRFALSLRPYPDETEQEHAERREAALAWFRPPSRSGNG